MILEKDLEQLKWKPILLVLFSGIKLYLKYLKGVKVVKPLKLYALY